MCFRHNLRATVLHRGYATEVSNLTTLVSNNYNPFDACWLRDTALSAFAIRTMQFAATTCFEAPWIVTGINVSLSRVFDGGAPNRPLYLRGVFLMCNHTSVY